MRRNRTNLFDELLHAVHYRELIEDMYNKLPSPTMQHAQQHVLGSVDWTFEIQLILKEVYSVDENRYGWSWK